MRQVLILCAAIFLIGESLRAAEPEVKSYRYSFTLTEKRSCTGTSDISPDDMGRMLNGSTSTHGLHGFLQLTNFETGEGEKSTVGFINLQFLVRFWLVDQ